MRHAPRGFTLIELLTAILIVSILASVAVPTYTAQVRKSRRTEARTALLDMAGREERLYSTTNAYSDKPSDLGYSGDAFPIAVGTGYYQVNVQVAAGPPATFTLTATPVSGKGQDKDKSCGKFTVTQTGKQTAKTAADADSADCWG